MPDPIRAHLVANARFHDTDFARLELLKLLGEDPEVRTSVGASYADMEGIAASDLLITYTCDLRPSPDEEQTLRRFVEAGGRWLALHATNAFLDFAADGIHCPRTHDLFMDTLGSRFRSHPPSAPYRVEIADPEHPLVAGLEPFETTDELYLHEYYGELTPLLTTRWSGRFEGGYVENEWPNDDPRLVAYTKEIGAGAVLYLTLGHCHGKYDMRPLVEIAEPARGSWELPVFYELLRRGIAWAKEPARTRSLAKGVE